LRLLTLRVMLHNIPIPILPFSSFFLVATKCTLPGAKVRCCTDVSRAEWAGRFDLAVTGNWGTNPNLFT
jgi:hypothetical protein